MAVSDLARPVALRAAAAAREGMALAAVWWNDILSYLSPEHRARLAKLLDHGDPVLITGDRDRGFVVDGVPLESAQPDRLRLISLLIETQAVMRRRLDVPQAVATELAAALRMNLETWTPFSEGDVYALARPIPESRSGPGSATIRIEIRCVARRAVDDRIAALADLKDLTPDALRLGDPAFEIARPTAKRSAMLRRQRWLLGLGALAVAEVATLHALVSGRQSDRIAGLEAEQERLTRALRQKAALGRKATEARESLRTIAAQFDARQSVSRALEVLASALPADTRIREIAFSRDRAEGTLVVAGAADLDIAGVLAPTGLFQTREIAADAASAGGPRLYSVVFALAGWIPNDRRPRR
ncbi:hypothetical protein [Methylobacterium mesophilicum]|uniref:hypothetical protein n=1 Tax=Methylobacterium mesophilicum TaxID=39956 RepID=UPI002F2C5C62